MIGFWHQVLSGVATGGIYASLALALVMIYQATHHVNFAQGEMATFSAFLAYTLLTAGVPYWAAFAMTVLISFILGAAVERILLRPVAGAPDLTLVGVFIGLLLILNALDGLIWDFTIKPFPTPFGTRAAARRAGLQPRARLARRDPVGAGPGLRLLPLHQARAGHARRRLQPGIEPPGRDQRRLDAGARLGPRRGDRRGGRDADRAGGVPRPEHDDRHRCSTPSPARCWAAWTARPAPCSAASWSASSRISGGAYLVGTQLKLSLALAVIACVLVLKPSGLLGRAVTSRV